MVETERCKLDDLVSDRWGFYSEVFGSARRQAGIFYWFSVVREGVPSVFRRDALPPPPAPELSADLTGFHTQFTLLFWGKCVAGSDLLLVWC